MDSRSSHGDPLTRRWPALAGIPRLALIGAPTPVQRLDALSRSLRAAPLLVKRDDGCAEAFGGCKVRGLEFGLGAAASAGADTILTCGTVGSNHVAATAVFARELGWAVRALVLPQPDGGLPRRNVMIARAAGAELVPAAPGVSLRVTGDVMQAQVRALRDAGRRPFILPFGGSDPRVGIAHVGAAIELHRQVRAGHAAAPARLYVAAASLTTAAGIAVGLKVAGLRCTVIAVQVAGDPAGDRTTARLLDRAGQVVSALRAVDPSFPPVRLDPGDVEVRDGRAGRPFGTPTPQSQHAAGVAAAAGIDLDGCYTAKAFAGCLHDAVERGPRSAPLLFWHTGNTRPAPGAPTVPGTTAPGCPGAPPG